MKKLIFVLIWLFFIIPCQAGIIYVDADATGANDGSSWADAYNYLQNALADASSSLKPVEIRVAQGIYRPDENAVEPNGTGNREATFQLINGVNLKGSYAGFGQPDPNARDIETYETILSGDLKGDDVDVNDPCDLGKEPTRAENSYNVVKNLGSNEMAVLDGFTITAGNANAGRGGGMYNNWGSPTVTNCTFSGNSASWSGGGMYNKGGSPKVINCTFSGNSARCWGGGMYNKASSPTVTNCMFNENWAHFSGGGMENNEESNPALTNCTFRGNSSHWGGGMRNDDSSPTLTNCVFSGNSAASWGGGMDNRRSSPTLTNCTFSGNSAYDGGGMLNFESSATVINCIFEDNESDYKGGGMANHGGNPTVANCTFIGNSATRRGGGMYNQADCDPTLSNCIFSENSAEHGGGIYNFESSPTLVDCMFRGNSATENGGAVCNDDSPSIFINCAFSNNSAGKNGGGMYNHHGIYNLNITQTLFNCTFSGNLAGNNGGGMCNICMRLPLLTNCTFSGNIANGAGGGIHASGGCIYYISDIPQILNCIFCGDTAAYGNEISLVTLSISYPSGASLTCASRISVGYSDIQGGWPGLGNIDADPCFVDPENGDYHLLVGSPCIDAGDPNYIAEPNETDLDGKPRVIGGRIDMGAYESTSIQAEVRITPRSINLASKGKWITCYIQLPEDHSVADIDSNSILLNCKIQAESVQVNEQQQVAIAKFSRSEVQGILNVGDVELTISGQLTDGTIFEGTDVIRVLNKAGLKSAK